MIAVGESSNRYPHPLLTVLTDEGLRLFFPLAALYAALWPFLWAVILGFELPLARHVPAAQWHPHEMLIGAYGAALLGFITTAIPQWSDTPRPGLRPLLALAALWGIGRFVGVLGFDSLGSIGAIADVAWMGCLVAYVGRVSWQRQTTRYLGFLFWLAALLAAELTTRSGFISGNYDLAALGLTATGLAFLGILALALARITVAISNRVLDPSGLTSPYRPHPGRQHLASGLVVVALAGELAQLSPEVRGFLYLAAGAGFLDRAGEAFIGRPFLRAEILCLFSSGLLAGLGLLAVGASRLGAPIPLSTGLHVALLGGLGLAVLAVLSLASLLHTQQPLRLPVQAKLSFVFVVVATGLRVLADAGSSLYPPRALLVASAIVWSAGFLVWLSGYWPRLSDPRTCTRHSP